MVGKHEASKHPKKQVKFMLSFVIVCQSIFIASTINHLSTSCAGFLGADNVGFRRAECSGPIAGHIPPRGEANQANSFTADVLPMRPTGWRILMRSCMELELLWKKRARSCSWCFLKICYIFSPDSLRRTTWADWTWHAGCHCWVPWWGGGWRPTFGVVPS